MRISDHAALLNIPFGNGGALHPALLWDDTELILVDAGFPGQYPLFQKAIEEEGFSMDRITRLLLTHEDMDHIGCARDILAENPSISIMAHRIEAPHINGELLPSKLLLQQERMDTLSPEEEEKLQERMALYHAHTVPIMELLTDGQVLSYCGGIRILHTPGHTPGHICLYLEGSHALITGDALNIKKDALAGPASEHTLDMELALASLHPLLDLPIQKVLSYHGGYWEGDFQDGLRALLAK